MTKKIVGATYIVTVGSPEFPIGSKVVLCHDDDTDMPLFSPKDQYAPYKDLSEMDWQYIHMEEVSLDEDLKSLDEDYSLVLGIDAKNMFPVEVKIKLQPHLKGDVWSAENLSEAVSSALYKIEDNIGLALKDIKARYSGIQVFDEFEGEMNKAVTFSIKLCKRDLRIYQERISYTTQAVGTLSGKAILESPCDMGNGFMNNVEQPIKEEF